MSKKAKPPKAKKGPFSFNVASVIQNINNKALERNKEKIEDRVAVMVNSLTKREAETTRYAGRVDRLLADLGKVKNVADLDRWFDKGY